MVSPRRLDVLVGVACGVLGAAATALAGHGALSVAGAALLGGSLGAARGQPRGAWLAAVGALILLAPARSEQVLAVYLYVPAHAFCAARRETARGGLAALAALLAGWELLALVAGTWGGVGLLLTTAAWGAGRALRERERLAAELGERARELEEEREAHAALSVRYERARIASEMHDIVAHAISVLVIQASAGQRLAARDPEATDATFGAIAGAARQAEEDMRRLVALLADEEAIGAAPDLALVEELIGRACGSGIDATLELAGEREGLPSQSVEAAYHVVQEGLTNALRYAAGAPVRVRVDGASDALLVTVTNSRPERSGALAGLGTGTGLRGLRERVGVLGGTVEAAPTSDGGWRLCARLPRRVTAAPAETSRPSG